MCEACGVPLGALVSEPTVCGWPYAVFMCESDSRALVFKLKHGDRAGAAVHLARWMTRPSADLIEHCDVIVPAPLHRLRQLVRTYNQSSLLANLPTCRLLRTCFFAQR
jgi:predicted amidophosphoribosyltransferase